MQAGARQDGAAAPDARRVLVPHDIAARAPRPAEVVHALRGRSMGTTWSVRVVGPRGLDLAPLQRGLQAELDEVVRQMSHWEPESDLGRFNRAAAGSAQSLPAAFADVLHYALSVARDSGGAYDPTAGALVNLWGFGPRDDDPGECGPRGESPPARVPEAGAIAAARERCGWQRLQLDAARARQSGGLQLDLSSVAKGYAVDALASHLDGRGLENHLVEVGGELCGTGTKPDGQPWWVAIEPPGRAAAGTADCTPTVIALHGLGVATSGDYRRFFLDGRDGTARRYSHTIDPRSGWPVAHDLASVSVVHPRCMAADALSTALMVMGPVQGPAWAQARGLAALFVSRRADGGFDEVVTPALAALAQ